MTKFVNPSNLIAYSGIMPGSVVADLGCGAGFYAIPASQAVGDGGTVYAVDIVEDKLSATLSMAKHMGCKNVMVVKADLEKTLTGIPEGSCDLVIMASILHEIGSRDALIKNAYKILKTGGKVLAVEWKKQPSPLGPAMESRVAENQLEDEFIKMGLRKEKDIPADTYHYSVLFVK
jgi:ubiquinone/menaquinone biosynthesis C-methylase UbiE